MRSTRNRKGGWFPHTRMSLYPKSEMCDVSESTHTVAGEEMESPQKRRTRCFLDGTSKTKFAPGMGVHRPMSPGKSVVLETEQIIVST